ncbi:PEP-CTERM sorting domain-containing protein [Rheinheimera metallidurans]|uniref:PEP-CTERM sorting domain-containing protein n=1 Tax=Rheinheimera metallidurans TaxID=2925781 RepID=UPI0030032592
MNKLLLSAALLFSSSSFAGIIGNVNHTYGTDNYIPNSMGTNSCDSKNTGSVTIKDTSTGCQRFSDVFDFSALDFDTIDRFELDLTFSGTNNRNCVMFIFCANEDWRILPASNGQRATLAEQTKLTRASGITQQTFVFDANTLSSLFNDIVDSKKFSLWFSEEAFGANNFNLYSANLTIHGSASQPVADEPAKVPAPASIALLGLGLLMLRRFKK